mmetsp:Transcript_37337/g.78180  ORF Transcript_37337/g.78180 Transcript_37337/m.78180 type:complete len:146 (-) Transcript_37337:133-570(-)
MVKQQCGLFGKAIRRASRKKAEFRNSKIIFSGWLWKQGEVNTNYKRRYAILTEIEMLYCKDETSLDPQGSILIDAMTQVRSGWLDGLTEYNGQPTDNGFVIATEGRLFRFVAEEEQHKYAWIQFLSQELMRTRELREQQEEEEEF